MRGSTRHEFELHLERDAGPVHIRLGPLPWGARIAGAQVDGQAATYRVEHSGDSDWAWVVTRGGTAAQVVLQLDSHKKPAND